jgi:hypothetical protein
MRGADVVVGGGRAALEALALGRRVATVKVTSDARGELGAPVTPHTLDDHVHDNFRWNERPPVPAGEVWEALERQPEASVALVSERVRHELSDDAMLDRELALLDELAGRRESREALLAAVSRYAAEVGGRWSRSTAAASVRRTSFDAPASAWSPGANASPARGVASDPGLRSASRGLARATCSARPDPVVRHRSACARRGG